MDIKTEVLNDIRALEFTAFLDLVMLVHWRFEVINLGAFKIICLNVTDGQAAEIADWLAKTN